MHFIKLICLFFILEMTYVYLVGAGYCERCKQICGRQRSKRVTRGKPTTLKYVRYSPGTIVTPGWNGISQPSVVPRIPAYWSYAGAVARRNARANVVVPVVTQDSGMVISRVSRKRKSSD